VEWSPHIQAIRPKGTRFFLLPTKVQISSSSSTSPGSTGSKVSARAS
jgi:hypothetical protein